MESLFRRQLISDNKNDTLKVNRFLANKTFITLRFIVTGILLLLLMNLVLNIVTDYFTAVKDGMAFVFDINIRKFLLPTFKMPYSKLVYAIIVILFIISSVKNIYYTRASYSEEDINKGHEGNTRWTTLEEVKQQYKAIPMYPSTTRKVDVKAGDETLYKDGRCKENEYVDRIIYDDNGEPKEKILKSPNVYKGKGGVPVLRWRDKFYIDTLLTNNLFLGTTRSGKGEMFVFPTIDIVSRAEKIEDRPSIIVTDPKLENYKTSKETLEKRGYKTVLINLDNPIISAGYNPLFLVGEYMFKGQKEDAQMLAKSFAYSIFYADNYKQDPIWPATATDLFTALILAVEEDCIEADIALNNQRKRIETRLHQNWLKLNAEEKKEMTERILAAIAKNEINTDIVDILEEENIEYLMPNYSIPEIYPYRERLNVYSIIHFFNDLTNMDSVVRNDDNENKGAVRNAAEKAENALDDYFNQRSSLDFAKALYNEIKVTGDKTKGSIYVSMLSPLSVFLLDSIAKMTTENTINFEEIGFGDKPIAIFIGIPTEDESNHFIAVNFVIQTFQYLFKLAKSKNGKVTRPVRFILDEFGNLPVFNNFSGMVTNCLGVGMSFDIFIQSYNQLNEKYEMSEETLKDNFANQIYIMAVGDDSADKFSALLGNRTMIEVQRTGERIDTRKTYNESTKQVPLMTSTDLRHRFIGECATIRVAHRTDLAGASVRPYPILAEYIENIFWWERWKIRRKTRAERLSGNIQINSDTGEKLSFKQQYKANVSDYMRRMGTAFLYRYQYATEDFPNPTEIKIEEIYNGKTRAEIDIEKSPLNIEQIINKIRARANVKDPKYNPKQELKTLSNYERIISLCRDEVGETWSNTLKFDENTPVYQVIDLVKNSNYLKKNERRKTVQSKLLKMLNEKG